MLTLIFMSWAFLNCVSFNIQREINIDLKEGRTFSISPYEIDMKTKANCPSIHVKERNVSLELFFHANDGICWTSNWIESKNFISDAFFICKDILLSAFHQLFVMWRGLEGRRMGSKLTRRKQTRVSMSGTFLM